MSTKKHAQNMREKYLFRQSGKTYIESVYTNSNFFDCTYAKSKIAPTGQVRAISLFFRGITVWGLAFFYNNYTS